jgi:hypothetical protein
LKKLAIIGLAMTAALAMTAVAVAQYALPVVQVEGKVTPTNAGTKKKPKNGSASVSFTVNRESASTVQQFAFHLPKHVKISGKGLRYCPATQINAQGPTECPKGSKVGKGSANVLVGPNRFPVTLKVDVYAGSRDEIAVYLSGLTPIALRGLINDAPAPYGQKVTVDIPQQVQQTPAGYVYLTGVDIKLGPKRGTTGKGRKKKKTNFVGVTGCPGDKTHDFLVRLTMADNPNPPAQRVVDSKDTVACVK